MRAHLASYYVDEPFVHVLAKGKVPQTQHVKGSNICRIAIFADRQAGRVIILSVLDNPNEGRVGTSASKCKHHAWSARNCRFGHGANVPMRLT